MSLRDFGVYGPMGEEPVRLIRCWICDRGFGLGSRTAIKLTQAKDEDINPEFQHTALRTRRDGGFLSLWGRMICATCHMRGTVVDTEDGWRVVDRIKEGDSAQPVVTTDGKEWREDEIMAVPSGALDPEPTAKNPLGGKRAGS